MKRIKDHPGMSLRPVRLYQQDVRDVWNAISETSAIVKMQACGFEITDPEELPQIPDRTWTTNLEIRADHPFVRVALSDVYAVVEGEQDEKSRGVVQKVTEILRRCERFGGTNDTSPSSICLAVARRYSVICFYDQKETFWHQYGRSILAYSIAGGIGAVAGALLTALLR